MKKLTCEMCGSTDLLKSDGVFVCQSCGIKYSVEEAKKMMVEGTVQVEGTVKVDNKDKIENYLKMAESAYESENLKEAEDYANKIIEIDPKYAEAWFIKGKAAGWQSTTANIRFSESIECWSNALKNASKERHDKMREEVEEETLKLAKALINIRANNFKSNPSEKNYKELCDFNTIINPFVLLITKAQLIISLNDLLGYLADALNSAAVGGFKTANEYYGNKREDMNKFKYRNWLDYTDNCIMVLKNAALHAQDEKTLDLIYENLEYIQNQIIDSKSYKFVATGYGSYYDVDTTLTATAKTARRNEIAGYATEKAKQLKEIKKKQKEERDEYFEKHPEEKEKLNNEIKESKSNNKKLLKEINDNKAILDKIDDDINNQVKPLLSDIKSLDKKIEKLEEEKSNLGLFKLKDKKEIKQKIETIEEEKEKLEEKITAEKSKLRKERKKEISEAEEIIEKDTKEISKNNKKIEKAYIKLEGEYDHKDDTIVNQNKIDENKKNSTESNDDDDLKDVLGID